MLQATQLASISEQRSVTCTYAQLEMPNTLTQAIYLYDDRRMLIKHQCSRHVEQSNCIDHGQYERENERETRKRQDKKISCDTRSTSSCTFISVLRDQWTESSLRRSSSVIRTNRFAIWGLNLQRNTTSKLYTNGIRLILWESLLNYNWNLEFYSPLPVKFTLL